MLFSITPILTLLNEISLYVPSTIHSWIIIFMRINIGCLMSIHIYIHYMPRATLPHLY